MLTREIEEYPVLNVAVLEKMAELEDKAAAHEKRVAEAARKKQEREAAKARKEQKRLARDQFEKKQEMHEKRVNEELSGVRPMSDKTAAGLMQGTFHRVLTVKLAPGVKAENVH